MNKTLLVVIAFFAAASASFAQGVSFGVKAGVNVANQSFKSEGISLSPDARTGFHVGGFVTAMFTEKLGLQPEVLYSNAGCTINFLGEKIKQKFDYVSVPVLVRYQPIEILNLHAGPQFGFLLNAEQEYDGETEDLKDGTKGLDVGAAFGAGIDLPMGLGFSARYILGLSNISDADEDFTMKNNILQLSVTFRFGGK
jgi:hypothetical protein